MRSCAHSRLLLALLVLIALAGCGGDDGPTLPAHPEALVGTYKAKAEAFVDEVTKAMRYGIRKKLESDDPVVAEEFKRRLESASLAWAKGLANELELRADGSFVWLVLERKTTAPGVGTYLIDLSPPEVPAAYRGTWRQVAPGEIAVVFTQRNGRTFATPQTTTCRVRPDGGLDAMWGRDDDMSFEEQPLFRE
jgi:hypothetical protein